MRKILLAAIAAATLVPTGAYAQDHRDIRHDQRDIRHDRQDVRHDRKDMRQDARQGDWQGVRADHRDIRQDRQDIRGDQRDIRHDRHQDWRQYREAHRDYYRRPAYRGPRGYVYRPIRVGYRFAPAYYGRNYWISNWDYYRLPPPGHGRRWVRYGNDVVLVNISNGVAIQIFGSFFL